MNQLPASRINVLVMHGDPILSAGLAAALRQDPRFEVFIQGCDDLAGEPHVDVAIADYAGAMQFMEPGGRKAHRFDHRTKILALTANDREADIRRAVEAGVHGYLLVGAPVAELIDGVVAVGSGLRYMSISVARRMADSLTRAPLTSRETEVLRLVAHGQPNKAIARQLRIELGTVKSHMSAIMAKLGATSRTHAARIAASRGLVEDVAEADRPSRAAPSARPETALQYA